ncbi:MAG TPA: bifunctional diguanylate cyclase/phosphodiesterase [Pyrinomonadaceae bacterium]|nr:bifunctional diguanylate cyclase/phosphodiesterase [Pyrinomonadaceae bacterium]
MSITLPRGRFVLSFSDALIFICFILYGGEAAILLASIEILANCVYRKIRGTKFSSFIITINIASSALSTFLTYQIFTLLLGFIGINQATAETNHLIPAIGVLAILQFLLTSGLAALYFSLEQAQSFFKVWKRECFSSSLTQIAGAGLAIVVYKVLTYGDLLTTAISLLFFGVIYISYRQIVADINESIEQADIAEREKAEIAKLKAEEAKSHAAELEILLEKEEENNIALLKSKNALEHAAFHDFLTDLPNRAYLVERLSLLIEIGIEISHKYFVLFIDLNRFKNINDSLGHTVGDRLLKLVGKRLVRLLRDEDTVARLGGDEFAIILNDLSSIEEATKIADKIHERLSQPYLVQGNKIFSGLNIGIAPFDVEHKSPEDTLRDADIAMHYAKERGSGVAVFNKELRARFLNRIELEADLRFAVERGQFAMHYQPLICLKGGELTGFEALLRWQHPQRGFVSPAEFIPIAEDSGLIVPMTQWILQETCRQMAQWQNFSQYENLIMSVNISGKHFTEGSLVKDVVKALDDSKLSPFSLKLEITESTAMENAEQTIEVLEKLKKIGIQLSMDDFGTGYSSLSFLHRLPFDYLKIDRSFVYNVGENGENSEILQTIMSLAKNLKMRVIAEGIETESQLMLLQNLGCDYGQGYLMSKPLQKDQMEKLLYKKRSWIPFVVTDLEASGVAADGQENLHIF